MLAIKLSHDVTVSIFIESCKTFLPFAKYSALNLDAKVRWISKLEET